MGTHTTKWVPPIVLHSQKQYMAYRNFIQGCGTLMSLKAIAGSGHQQLKMADSEFQPLDFRNTVMGLSK